MRNNLSKDTHIVAVFIFAGWLSCLISFFLCFVFMGIMFNVQYMIILILFHREVYALLPSLCWIKCQLQSWLQLQWRAASSPMLKSMKFHSMSCSSSTSRWYLDCYKAYWAQRISWTCGKRVFALHLNSYRICWLAAVLRPQHSSQNGKPRR